MSRIVILILILTVSISYSQAQTDTKHSNTKKTQKDKKKKDRAAFDAELDALVDEEVRFDIPVITGYQLKELSESGDPLIVLDARAKEDYDKKHIKNAKWIGEEDFSIERIWMLDQSKTIVLYGSMGGKTEAIAQQLEKVGFKKIYNLHGNLDEWAKYKYVVLD